MSDVSVWRLYAYMNDDETGHDDEVRRIAEWQVEHVMGWCVTRGYDHIYLYREQDDKTRFRKSAPAPVRHRMHLVEGSRSEQQPGDDAA